MSLSVVMAAGGTGGHVVPALAIAEAVRRARPEASVSFIGTSRGLERDLIGATGYRLHVTSVRPFARTVRGMLGPLSMIPATWQARAILKSERAEVVVGMGGYPSLPAIAAARMMGIPRLIHEANAIPGLANDVAAKLTPNVAVSFPVTASAFGGRARVVGMPLRQMFASFDREALRAEAMKHFALDPSRPAVLVFGGSLGALRLSRAAVEIANRWRARDDRQLVIIAGVKTDEIAASLRDQGFDTEGAGAGLIVRCVRLTDRMDLAYAMSDLAIARAGASTVSELAAVGLASILVPLPHARRREQHANARLLTDAGAAVLVEDAQATGDTLASFADELLNDADRRAHMAVAARGVARPHAADELASWAIELAEARRG